MSYAFKQLVKSAKKMQPEGDDAAPFVRVTLDNGHRIKVPLDGSVDAKVLGALRKGVIVEGKFDTIHGWTPEGQRFAQVSTLLNADIEKVSKGEIKPAEVDETIEPINWDNVEATVQKAYVPAGETTETTGAAPDMNALAGALAKPKE
jgi:hypothetical protein